MAKRDSAQKRVIMGSQFKIQVSNVKKFTVGWIQHAPHLESKFKRSSNPTRPLPSKSSSHPPQAPHDPRTSSRSAKSTEPFSFRSSGHAGGAQELEAQSAASEAPPTLKQTLGRSTTQSPLVRQHARGAQALSVQSDPRPMKTPPPVSQPAGVRSEHCEPKQQAPIEGGGHGDGAQEISAPSNDPPAESHSSLNTDAQVPLAKQHAPGAGMPNSPPRASMSSR